MGKKSRSKKCKCKSAGQTKTREQSLLNAVEKDSLLMDSGYALSTTAKSLELVEWQDANYDVADKDWNGYYINATVGWTEEEAGWLKVSGELTPDGERAVTRIPLRNVWRRQILATSGSTSTTSLEPTA